MLNFLGKTFFDPMGWIDLFLYNFYYKKPSIKDIKDFEEFDNILTEKRCVIMPDDGISFFTKSGFKICIFKLNEAQFISRTEFNSINQYTELCDHFKKNQKKLSQFVRWKYQKTKQNNSKITLKLDESCLISNYQNCELYCHQMLCSFSISKRYLITQLTALNTIDTLQFKKQLFEHKAKLKDVKENIFIQCEKIAYTPVNIVGWFLKQ